jgi:IS5 family transposase
MTTRQRQGKGSRQTATYWALISIAEEVVAGARKALDDSAAMRAKDPLIDLKIEALRDEITHCCGLGERVIDHARRRVLNGEQVPNAEKIYSIFEAWQGAHASGIWSQGISRRKRQRLGYPV